MKNLIYLFSLVLLISSCSKEEVTTEKELKTSTPELNSNNNRRSFGLNPPCVNSAFIQESSTTAPSNGTIGIQWNNSFIMQSCNVMRGKIEIFADGLTDPNTNTPQTGYPYMHCYGNITTPVATSIPVNFFNTNNHTIIVDDLGTKCFWWRIVLEGQDCHNFNGNCVTATLWRFASTYGL